MTDVPRPADPAAQPAEPPQTVAHLDAALHADPLNPALHRALADALRAAGDETGWLAHQIAVATFAVATGDTPAARALPLYNLATAYYQRGVRDAARRWYAHTLDVHPDFAAAHQNLAALLSDLGDAAAAERHRMRAYSLQRVFVEPVAAPRSRMLVLCTGKATGNVPFERLLKPGTTTLIKYAIDYAADAEDAQLPPHDLVFNAIGDPDVAAPLAARLERFMRQCAQPVLNVPAAVARTRRDMLPDLLKDIDDVVVPRCARIDPPASAYALAAELAARGLAYPLLMRPLAAHGGAGLALHASADTLWPALAAHGAPCYLTQYCDTRRADGHYRKYRSIFVDRMPFPYHAAISTHWMVHYFSADMTAHAWKLAEEQRFLDDPAEALGARALRALHAIARRIDLDYAGIDFTLLPDGRVLVFETNATMLVHAERRDGPLAHKNASVERIVHTFAQMQDARQPRGENGKPA